MYYLWYQVGAIMKKETIEKYLKAILILQNHDTVRSKDIADYLHLTKASVSVAMQKLRIFGYIEDDIEIVLTSKGYKIAKEVYDRYTWWMQILIKAGVDPNEANVESYNFEHTISNANFIKLKEYFKDIL